MKPGLIRCVVLRDVREQTGDGAIHVVRTPLCTFDSPFAADRYIAALRASEPTDGQVIYTVRLPHEPALPKPRTVPTHQPGDWR